eukprot:s1039_g17.t2
MSAVPMMWRRRLRGLGKLALAAAAAGLSVLAYQKLQERWRRKQLEEHLERWTSRGPAKEPVVECQVPVEHGASGEDLEYDVVEVPVGLAFECERLRHQLREKFLCDDLKLVEELSSYFANKGGEEDEEEEALLQLPWIDLAALAQLTRFLTAAASISERCFFKNLVDTLDGKRFKFDDVSTEITGRELQRMISERLPYKGSGISVQHGSSPLSLKQTLLQQGIAGKEVTLSYVYLPVNLYSAWSYLQGQLPEEVPEEVLEGVTGIKGMNSINPLDWHLPKSLRSLTLGWDFNRSLEHVNFPSGLQSITFGVNFNQSLEETHLPNGLRNLTLGEMFNQSLDRVTLPSSLQSLTFGSCFNRSLDGVTFPDGLQMLTFGRLFNQSLNRLTLPMGLQSLTFGIFFNQTLDEVCLPAGLKNLTFGGMFNKSLDRVALPEGLQCLTFGDSFNQSLSRLTLPMGLQSLKFGEMFNQGLDQLTLPDGLRSLTFGNSFNQSPCGLTLPHGLQSLSCGNSFNQSLDEVILPSSLQSLTLGYMFDLSLNRLTLPNGLQSLTFSTSFNYSLLEVTWPCSLRSLTFGQMFNQSLTGLTLPSNLQHLTLGSNFNQSLDEVALPHGLRSLTLGQMFNQNLDRLVLPKGLQSLEFGEMFNQSLDQVTLPSLRSLTFGAFFDQSLDNVILPNSLQSLTFGTAFNRSLDRVTLPHGLQSLTFGEMFDQSLDNVILPESLQSLTFGSNFRKSLDLVHLPDGLNRLTFCSSRFTPHLDEAKMPLHLKELSGQGYWYDRRPRGDEEVELPKEERPRDAKYGRWTKKISREKVIYSSVGLKSRVRTRGHLGAKVFRRPAGVDVTRLSTLQRAASLCGHDPLLELVETTMESLRPRNVARIPWSEVEKHSSKDDLWLLIDGKVYDVTSFLSLHPGGGQLVVDAAAQDSTSLFERTHGEGLRYSLRLLNQFFIGVCENPGEAKPAEEEQPTPEFLSTLRSITGALHTFDEAKATGEAQGILR